MMGLRFLIFAYCFIDQEFVKFFVESLDTMVSFLITPEFTHIENVRKRNLL